MGDMPFFPAGGSGNRKTDYDKLENVPVINIAGSPVVVSQLSTGVYNVEGTWSLTPDDEPRETLKDDLFYVSNEDGQCKLTWISAGEMYQYIIPNGGTMADIVTDANITTGNAVDKLVSVF